MMPPAFDKCPTRPAHIDAILNGLDRYNPETTTIFQDYVTNQCEEKTFDAYACLALMKLFVNFFSPWCSIAQRKMMKEKFLHVSYYLSLQSGAVEIDISSI